MGKAARRRRKQQRRRQKKKQSKALARARTRAKQAGAVHVTIHMEQLELARGYDGLLRGAPEAAIILGLFRIDRAGVRAIGRYLYRFERPEGFPCKVSPRDESKETIAFNPSSNSQIVLLAMAVEEDSGRGLQTLYAALEQGDDLVVWTNDEAAPVPTHLPELTGGMLPSDFAHRIHLMFGQHDPSVRLGGDDWIDANLLWTSVAPKQVRHRLHFVSADGRNDWTSELMLTVRR